jgi:hypothetical protein
MSYNRSSNTQPVNWLRTTVLSNGVTVSVSDKSGILKIQSHAENKMAMMGFSDDFAALFAAAIEIQRFIEANSDVCFSSGESRESRKIKQVQQRNLAKAVNTLQDLDPKLLEQALQALLKKQA